MTDFQSLYAMHFQSVYRFVLSLGASPSAAEDITQETFFKAMTAISGFREECGIVTWLLRIAKNQYFSVLRKQKTLPSAGLAESMAAPENVEESLLDKERLNHIHRCLHTLEEPYREVFTLRVFGELSHAQIAALFQKTEAWARVMFYRSKVKLQERMREDV